MTQSECIMQIIDKNGGYAELSYIYDNAIAEYQNIFNEKNYKTNIRSLLQKENKNYFRIKPGMWSLNESKSKLPKDIQDMIEKPSISYYERETEHARMQANLIYIGKSLNFTTYIYAQDRNRVFSKGKRLNDIVDLTKIPNFTYKEILKKIRTIDVVWFDDDISINNIIYRYPEVVFEVESSTNFKESLNKFNYLKMLNIRRMYIIAPEKREEQFNKIIELEDYKDIRSRVKFLHYEDIELFLENPKILIRYDMI